MPIWLSLLLDFAAKVISSVIASFRRDQALKDLGAETEANIEHQAAAKAAADARLAEAEAAKTHSVDQTDGAFNPDIFGKDG